MGRRISASTAAASGSVLLPGQLPIFGSGRFAIFPVSGSWTPPAGVFRARFRVWGGGGGTTADGGSSSVGVLLSATGGAKGVVGAAGAGGLGGIGVGGDFQASGGPGGAGEGAGGGAAGTEMGVGGAGGIAQALGHGGGGGAVGGFRGGNGGATGPGQGASPFEQGPDNVYAGPGAAPNRARDIEGAVLSSTGFMNPLGVTIPFPGFAFIGGGGSGHSSLTATQRSGGQGAGGQGGFYDGAAHAAGGYGGDFGGGGGATVAAGSTAMGGYGGRRVSLSVQINTLVGHPVDQLVAGGCGGAKNRSGSGGGGYARGEFAVTPDTPISITVAAQNPGLQVAGGLVIVEF